MKNDLINVLKKCINKIVNSELIIIFTGILLFAKMALFYKETIYQADVIEIDIIAKTFIFSMFIVTFLFIFKNNLWYL